jgi:hypothetical protein
MLATQANVELAIHRTPRHRTRRTGRQRLGYVCAPPLESEPGAITTAIPETGMCLAQTGSIASAPPLTPHTIPADHTRLSGHSLANQQRPVRRDEHLDIQATARQCALTGAAQTARGDHGVARADPAPGGGRHRIVGITGEQPPLRVELPAPPLRGEVITQIPHQAS